MLPLTEKVRFKKMLQKENRVQVPKKVRWHFKMDTKQLLKVSAYRINVYRANGRERFYAKMGKDGRITIPKLQRHLLITEEQTRYVMDVVLEPA